MKDRSTLQFNKSACVSFLKTALFVFVALIITPSFVFASTLLEVRVGPHKNFDRIVFEFDSETSHSIVKTAQGIEVRFSDSKKSSTFVMPGLATGMLAVKAIQAYQNGKQGLTFVIPLSRDVSVSQIPLAGSPWRLAVDLTGKLAEREKSEKPEYIPGDLPIPTKLADEKGKADEIHEEEIPVKSEPVKEELAQTTEHEHEAVEPAKAHAVLAYYFLAIGDTPRAMAEADRYQELAGSALDLPEQLLIKHQKQNLANQTPSNLPLTQTPLIMLIAIAFGAGVAGGVLAGIVAPKIKFTRVKKEKSEKSKATDPRKQAEELEKDIAKLREITDQEKTAKPVKAKTPTPAVEISSEKKLAEQAPSNAEEELRESLMDKRVKRVLELSGQGTSIAAIAQELEMGQDEVKLIIDLNQ